MAIEKPISRKRREKWGHPGEQEQTVNGTWPTFVLGVSYRELGSSGELTPAAKACDGRYNHRSAKALRHPKIRQQ
jgi:hypothetical protein